MSRLRTIAMATAVSVLFVIFLASASTPGTNSTLEEQVNFLTERVTGLEQELEILSQDVRSQHPDPRMEQEATKALQEVRVLANQGKLVEARDAITEFMESYSGTKAGKQAQGLHRELSVIGKPTPDNWAIDKWFQGENEIDLDSGDPTILVFWETWCPHCRREVPKLQATYERYRDQGLQILGLSKFSRGATEEKLLAFIDENSVEFPIAKESGALSAHFGVSGIPAVAVVKDQQVVWRGHPARLTQPVLEGLLQ